MPNKVIGTLSEDEIRKITFKIKKTYWINTSSNFMIRELLEYTGEEGLKTLERIFNQEEVAVRITENVRFGNNLSASEVWELMLYSDYLTINGRLDDRRYLVRIPNIEITNFFKDEFLTIVFGNYDKVDRLRDALRDKNIEQLNKSIEELVLYTMSSHDITKYYENLYHMLNTVSKRQGKNRIYFRIILRSQRKK